MSEELEPASVRHAVITDEEQQFELTLRPTRLADYIGQRKATDNLRVFMRAALQRHESLDHVLLTGPPGLGKTTLSNFIANEMAAALDNFNRQLRALIVDTYQMRVRVEKLEDERATG